MTIKEAHEGLMRSEKEYEEARTQLREKYTSAQIGHKLKKLRKKYGVRYDSFGGELSGIHLVMPVDDVVAVEDVYKTTVEIRSIFGKRTKKAWRVSASGLSFVKGIFSGAGRLKKGQQIRISGKFKFRRELEYDGDGNRVTFVSEVLPFKTKVWKY